MKVLIASGKGVLLGHCSFKIVLYLVINMFIFLILCHIQLYIVIFSKLTASIDLDEKIRNLLHKCSICKDLSSKGNPYFQSSKNRKLTWKAKRNRLLGIIGNALYIYKHNMHTQKHIKPFTYYKYLLKVHSSYKYLWASMYMKVCSQKASKISMLNALNVWNFTTK